MNAIKAIIKKHFDERAIRTYTPIIAGTIAAWLLSKGIDVEPAILVPVVTAIWYQVGRYLEDALDNPKSYLMLGAPKKAVEPTE